MRVGGGDRSAHPASQLETPHPPREACGGRIGTSVARDVSSCVSRTLGVACRLKRSSDADLFAGKQGTDAVYPGDVSGVSAMGRITVLNHVSLDGVMQSPARPDDRVDHASRATRMAALGVLRGLDEVVTLKQQSAGDLLVMGSGVLVRSLLERDLVDRSIASAPRDAQVSRMGM